MARVLAALAAAVLVVMLWGQPAAASAPILPAPAVERPGEGAFQLDGHTVIAAPAGDASALASARYLADLLARTRGLKLAVIEGSPGPGQSAIVLRRGAPAGEGYLLDVTPQDVAIQSNGDAGLFYGAVSVWQLATPAPGAGPVAIPAVHVEDTPRFGWRGLMLDSARHFQSPAFVEQLIDRMARAKLNTLQWHLTDDQGWRLQILKYPRLTDVAAWRTPAGPAAAADIDPKTGRPRVVGGFYTQDQVREIVAYAAARHVSIVPEIEMPGHAQAAIAAYPELGSGGHPPPGPSPDWGVHPYLYNVDDKTFAVLEDVLTEVMALFPSRYVHVGGDEAVKDQWKADPAVQAHMKALWIGDESALQGWFMGRIGTFLAAHGRKLVGWDEILQGGVAPGATVMSWRGLDGAIIASKLGHDVVLAPAPIYYFDNRQGGDPDQPPGRGLVIALKTVYDFEPIPPVLTPLDRTHVLGVQAQLWSEHIRTEARVAQMAFPRALAIAETGWTPQARKDWTDFTTRLDAELARERSLGEPYGTWPPASAIDPASRTRASQELKLCSERISLNLEDDAPIKGPRARFLVDIMNPCWIWPAADLAGVSELEAGVGQLPFNFQIGDDIKKIVLRPPATPAGELVVRQDRCDGPVIATLPLAQAARSQAVTRLRGAVTNAQSGPHDLCFTFTQATLHPFWVLDRVTLGPLPSESTVAADLVLVSPLDGWASRLSEVPDPVFAEAMLGDGVAVDPTIGVLKAPCDGVVSSLHAAGHAVSLRTAEGVEILLHIGLDTVSLGGKGFGAHVAAGEAVRTGQPLISFDLDETAQRAKSLISPMVITEAAGFEIVARHVGRLVAAGEPLLELKAGAAAAARAPVEAGPVVTRTVVVPLAHGLHARPAARIAQCAAAYRAEVTFAWAGRQASARSPVALMTLGLAHGDAAQLSAAGADAEDAVAALATLIESGMGESRAIAPPAPLKPTVADTPRDGLLRGVTAAPGLAIGVAARLTPPQIVVAEQGEGVAQERAALAGALAQVAARLSETRAGNSDPTRQAILAAHASFLEDPTLAAEAARLIGEGKSAGFAWRAAVGGFIDALKGLADRRMAERVDDLADLERRVLAALSGEENADPEIPAGAILLADELLPSQLMAIPAGRLAGICTAGGGPTSHVAILAAAMGVPAVVAVGASLGAVNDGATLILDADAATLQVSPGARALEAAQGRLAARAARREQARAAACDPARLADGTPLPVLANLGSLADAKAAAAGGAEGSGLLRTEFLFLERETAPDEDEQFRCYQAIADALEGRPLVIRLLDIGGDKPVAYLPGRGEENPALGVRGVRLLLRSPSLLRAQLRAILRVEAGGRCSIMIPMVARLSELRAIRAALDEARADLGVSRRVDLGVMIETPAAAMVADQLAREADFLSIGTNDLTQYALATDRGHPELAAEVDGLDPAVLRLIQLTCAGGASQGLWTSVCGGLAGDPAAIPILVGLGVAKLSMTTAAIPEAKALIRTLSPEACRKLAAGALAAASADEVRALSDAFLHGGA